MLGMSLPDIERCSPRVVVVRGLNPGLLTGPGTNTYLIGSSEAPLLLDTGVGREDYIPLLERALHEQLQTDAPAEILVSHAHPDHLGGVASLLERFGPRQVRKLPHPKFDGGTRITTLCNGAEIRSGGATLRALHTPGHAPDHLCFYLEEEQALFTGDLVLGAGTVVIPADGGDMSAYLASLERLLELELDRIYPGHGPMIRQPTQKLQEYLDHRRMREAQIIAAIRDGLSSIEAMVERIYADTPQPLHGAAGQSVLSHLQKLEHERRARRALDPAGVEHWSLI